MSSESGARFFDQKAADGYDEKNGKAGAIQDNLHLLIRLILQDLPADAQILCVGVGTGVEIARLARIFPGWRFTGIDPSAPMLDVCRKRIEAEGLNARCALQHGYAQDLPAGARFDAALCLLVTHFVQDTQARQDLFNQMASRLKSGGYLINADISDDMGSPEFADMIGKWKALHGLMGAPGQNLEGLTEMMRTHLAVAPPTTMEDYIRRAGLPLPVLFFQSLLIKAWYARKP